MNKKLRINMKKSYHMSRSYSFKRRRIMARVEIGVKPQPNKQKMTTMATVNFVVLSKI